jgi:hypothetical protein
MGRLMADRPAKPGTPGVDDLPLSGDDDLSAAVAEAFEADGAPDPAADPPEGTPAPDRDEAGRFKAKGETDPADPAKKVEEADPPVDPAEDGAAAPAATAAEPEDLDPPANWPLDVQETFRKQPPEVQKYMLDRHKDMERDYHAKTQEVAPVRQILDKWRPYVQQHGSTPEQAFDALMDTERVLRTGTPQAKLDMLMQVARTYQIELPSPAAPAAVEGEEPDPILTHPAFRQLAENQQKINDFLQQQAQGQQQQTATQSQQAVATFQEEKDASGKAAHPYFPEVMNDMLVLAQGERAMGRTPALKELYDRACWANPTVRAKIQSAEQHTARKADEKRKREEAERAKKAAVSISGAPSSSAEKPKTLEEEVSEAMGAYG